jgi:hypothetical protein
MGYWEIICYNGTKFYEVGNIYEVIEKFLIKTKLSIIDIKQMVNHH